MSLSTTDPAHLRPANPGDVAESISHALRYDGRRRRVRHADSTIGAGDCQPIGGHLPICSNLHGKRETRQPQWAAIFTSRTSITPTIKTMRAAICAHLVQV